MVDGQRELSLAYLCPEIVTGRHRADCACTGAVDHVGRERVHY